MRVDVSRLLGCFGLWVLPSLFCCPRRAGGYCTFLCGCFNHKTSLSPTSAPSHKHKHKHHQIKFTFVDHRDNPSKSSQPFVSQHHFRYCNNTIVHQQLPAAMKTVQSLLPVFGLVAAAQAWGTGWNSTESAVWTTVTTDIYTTYWYA